MEVDRIEPAYVQVANQLRAKIVSGELKPGDRLPVELDLAERFGVSRSTVREALRQLATLDLVETSRGPAGTRVAQPSSAAIESYLTSTLGLMTTGGEMSKTSMLEARAILEPSAAALAAQRRTEDQLHDLASALFDPSADPYETIVGRTRRFHLELLACADNPMIQLMGRTVYHVLGTDYIEKASSDTFWQKVDREHRAIHAAVAAGDTETAEHEMRTHLQDLRIRYQQIEDAGSHA